MPNYFLITLSTTGPTGHIYHGSPPLMDGARHRLAQNGAMVLYGPKRIPDEFDGQPIDVLMAVWRGEKPKLGRVPAGTWTDGHGRDHPGPRDLDQARSR